MDKIIGIDLAKQYFQVHAANHRGEVIERRKLTRDKVRTYMSAQQPAVVVMEACGSAHHWSREFAAMAVAPGRKGQAEDARRDRAGEQDGPAGLGHADEAGRL